MIITLILALAGDDDAFRVEGPPFLAFDGSAVYEAVVPERDAVVVWRLADVPGGAGAVETEPRFSPNDLTLRGPRKIRLRSRLDAEGDMRLTVAVEKQGRRVASRSMTVRVGRGVRIPASVRLLDHVAGGPLAPRRFTGEAELKRLAESVNEIWRACGIEFDFTVGKPVRAPDKWFDAEGRFQPIERRDGRREKSAALAELFRLEDHDAVDVFVARDCHWVESGRGWASERIDWTLVGVAFKTEGALVDEEAQPVDIAHELGHVLGLDDLGAEARSPAALTTVQRRRLMCSVRRFREAAGFTFEEMKTVRATAARLARTRKSP